MKKILLLIFCCLAFSLFGCEEDEIKGLRPDKPTVDTVSYEPHVIK